MQEDHTQAGAYVPATAALRASMPIRTPPAVIPHSCLLPYYQDVFTVTESARWAYQGCDECLDNLKEHRRGCINPLWHAGIQSHSYVCMRPTRCVVLCGMLKPRATAKGA